MAKTCNVALIGRGFMGKAHSNAHLKVARFFDVPLQPVMHTVVDVEPAGLEEWAARWGWQHTAADYRTLADQPEIDLVDVCTPNDRHPDPAIAMLEAGKHVACEKPLAGTLADARQMKEAAAKEKQSKTFVWFNYRRCPAVALAHQLVRAGRIGKVYHVRATYLQDWGGPDTPLLWRFQKKRAGSGAHGDLNAHIIDMARFVTGDEITEVSGAIAETFIKKRAIPGTDRMGRADVDDCVLFLARFRKGGVASFEASRLATGHQNNNTMEINGELGSVRFSFEDMNLLWFYDNTLDKQTAGWRRIMCTSAAGEHPYVDAWWPDAHVLGYEHGFINMAADILQVLGRKKPLLPLPDFADAYETQRVLEAAMLSAENRCAIKLSEVK
jgi:predicted dehydrogenase